MITCNLLGGLGNQLFQIFTTISYALDNKNRPAFIYATHTPGMTKRTTYWDTFLASLYQMIIEKLPDYKSLQFIREESFAYKALPAVDADSNVLLLGYFQSYKYFTKHYSDISRLIKLESRKQSIRNNTHHDLENTISLHFRIGDYKKVQEYHGIMPVSYYMNAIRFVLEKTLKNDWNMLYFCEDQDVDEVSVILTVLREAFPTLTFESDNMITEDWQQLLLMSCCAHNIIANSTFSWWGAYFNANYQKIVCYPNQWFGPSAKHDTRDLFPQEWNCISIN